MFQLDQNLSESMQCDFGKQKILNSGLTKPITNWDHMNNHVRMRGWKHSYLPSNQPFRLFGCDLSGETNNIDSGHQPFRGREMWRRILSKCVTPFVQSEYHIRTYRIELPEIFSGKPNVRVLNAHSEWTIWCGQQRCHTNRHTRTYWHIPCGCVYCILSTRQTDGHVYVLYPCQYHFSQSQSNFSKRIVIPVSPHLGMSMEQFFHGFLQYFDTRTQILKLFSITFLLFYQCKISSFKFHLFTSLINRMNVHVSFQEGAANDGGLPSGWIDSWWEDSNPRAPRPKARVSSASSMTKICQLSFQLFVISILSFARRSNNVCNVNAASLLHQKSSRISQFTRETIVRIALCILSFPSVISVWNGQQNPQKNSTKATTEVSVQFVWLSKFLWRFHKH